MQPIATITRHEAIDHDELPVRNWRVSQLKRCGIPGPLAEAYANHIDWHQATRAQEPAARHQPVLVILDLGHRELDSMEVIRRLRGCTEAPIIVLSGHASSIGEVVVMDAGARKSPTGSRAAYRRTVGDGDTSPVRIADLFVDLTARQVTRRRRDSDTAGQAADIRLTQPSGDCWKCCSSTPASCSASSSCWPRCGGQATPGLRATSGCTSHSCVANWSPTQPGRAGCSPSLAWAIAFSQVRLRVTANSRRAADRGS